MSQKSILRLDHIAISARSISEGATFVEKQLGVSLSPGGQHPQMATHNRLLSLGPEIYLEVIAIDPDHPKPSHPRWFNLDNFSGTPQLTNWIARCDDMASAIADAPAGIGDIVSFTRGELSWQMAVPRNGKLPFDGAYPALITWQGGKHPANLLPDRGCRLKSLRISHPDAGALRRMLEPQNNLDLIEIIFGPTPKIIAVIDTPAGIRELE